MKFAKYILIILLSTCLSAPLLAQSQSAYPKGYFMFPIKPGQRNYLAANMGELRPNHFHGGMDIKTDGQIGLPVYACADGYVSRLRVSTNGYGNTLYITHPNGLVTVYAHLDKFNATIHAYELEQLYARKETDIDIVIPAGTLPVKKGDIIAKSGNTGGSGGPHLHFEIRDSRENVLNPALFGFTEIVDNIKPTFDKVAIRTMDIDSRINGELGRAEYTAQLVSTGKYTITQPINAKGLLGIEIKVHDKMNETHNVYGINCIELKVDGKEVFYHNLETYAFNESRYINVHIDYETYILKRQYFQKCYVADGNNLNFYLMNPLQGKILIKDTASHKIDLRIYDSNGNASSLSFTVKGKQEQAPKITKPATPVPDFHIYENTLKITGSANNTEPAILYFKNKIAKISPAYYINQSPVYVYDLRTGLPDSSKAGTYTAIYDFVEMVSPGKKKVVVDNLTIQFSDSTLFDTLYLRVKKHLIINGQETFEINNPTEPVYGPIGVTFCPEIAANKNERCYFYSINNSVSKKYEGGVWQEDNLVHNLKYLGKFTVLKDSIPPVITYKSNTTKRINFSIFDRGSGIDSIYATLNGEWVMMYYEHKTGLIWSEFKDPTEVLKGEFVLEITDNAGNTSTYKKTL
ncbi:M23 family metallopeptidase [Cytophaga aurantiaca]|uniref:M23 family metallopeptidase n=1 Tax=Cytophaga aurantiaca TaxID=29530 RepID=UPI000686C3C1|nr:M23 family metallopeptidase [Cytophaga aurantiaca]